MNSNPSRKAGALEVPAFMSVLLILEAVIDLIPPDELLDPFLIPLEVAFDVGILVLLYIGQRMDHPRGRQLRGRAGRRGLSGYVIFAVLYWLVFFSILYAEYWLSTKVWFLAFTGVGLSAIIWTIPIDLVFFVIGVLVTWFALRSGSGNPRTSGRQLSPR